MQLVKSNEARKFIKEGKSLVKSASRDLQHSKSQLGKQFQELYPELASAVREFAGRAAQQTRHFASATSQELGVVGTRAVKYMDSNVLKFGVLYVAYRWIAGHPEVSDVAEKVKRHVEQRPVESAIIAAGAGYLIGRLLRW